MRAFLFLAAASLWAVPAMAQGQGQGQDGSQRCVASQPLVDRGGANEENQRYHGQDDWYAVQVANNCGQTVMARVCIASASDERCNVITVYPGHRDDYGFADERFVRARIRYNVDTCYAATVSAGRCAFDASVRAPVDQPNDDRRFRQPRDDRDFGRDRGDWRQRQPSDRVDPGAK